MSLQATYEKFLAAPNLSSLAENASLNYIPTLKTFNQPGPIIRHLENQSKNEVRKKNEKIIGIVEGHQSISVDVDTTLEFIYGGGAYLPGLENFVSDRIATLPTVHVVHFDQANKIQRIRIHWDQGSLLKQVEVIGSRGKNWPISDGKDQSRLITSALAGIPSIPAVTRGREAADNGPTERSISPSKRRIQDPHSSLSLFTPQEEVERQPQPNLVAPRELAKPVEREHSELFAAGHEDLEPDLKDPGSPKKNYAKPVIAAKGAGGSKFQPSRLFDEVEEDNSVAKYKSNPAKYNHFDLGEVDEHDPFQHKADSSNAPVPMRAKTNKHLSQWDFKDFVTPEKVHQRIRGQDVRHFSFDDEGGDHEETRDKNPRAQQARPDAKAHFEFKDDGTPGADQNEKRIRPKSGTYNTAQNLYENNLYDDGTHATSSMPGKKPLNAVTNNIGRAKDFDSQWAMADSSPAATGKVSNENKPIAGNRQKAVQRMGASWESYDQSPEQNMKSAPAKGIKKGLESHWSFGDDEEHETVNGKKGKKNYWDF